jgi:hypothetical protein
MDYRNGNEGTILAAMRSCLLQLAKLGLVGLGHVPRLYFGLVAVTRWVDSHGPVHHILQPKATRSMLVMPSSLSVAQYWRVRSRSAIISRPPGPQNSHGFSNRLVPAGPVDIVNCDAGNDHIKARVRKGESGATVAASYHGVVL